MDGFFDMPAGYSDADLEMAELEAEGNRRARLRRKFRPSTMEQLEAGETVEMPCRVRETGETYTAAVRLDVEAFRFWYSVNGGPWHDSAKTARVRAAAVSS